jgi:hypothetical protein
LSYALNKLNEQSNAVWGFPVNWRLPCLSPEQFRWSCFKCFVKTKFSSNSTISKWSENGHKFVRNLVICTGHHSPSVSAHAGRHCSFVCNRLEILSTVILKHDLGHRVSNDNHSKTFRDGSSSIPARSVDYTCALCNEIYSSSCDFNPWWAFCCKVNETPVNRLAIELLREIGRLS